MTAHFERDNHCRDAQDAVGGRDNYDFHGRSPVNMASREPGADAHRCNTNLCQMQGPQHPETPAGNRLRVEISHGRARGGGDRGGYGGGGGGFRGRSGPNWGSAVEILERSRNKGSAYRALVKGLPASASWQDLKVPFACQTTFATQSNTTASMDTSQVEHACAAIRSVRISVRTFARISILRAAYLSPLTCMGLFNPL